MADNFVKTISDLLDPYQIPDKDTSGFVGVPHDEILYAYEYWLQYLKLLVKEPFTIQITQGPQDEGADLILRCLNSNKEIGLQVKSYMDLNDKEFRKNLMAQIAYSEKHELEKLIIILCADLQDKSQGLKVRNMMSQVSQMQRGYVSVIGPEKAYPVYECYKNKKHPLVYLARNRQVIDLIYGLAESLSTKDCKAEISVKFNYVQQDNVKKTRPISGKIVFKPFQKEQQNNPIDKLARLQQLHEKVEFKNEIDKVIIEYPGGRKDVIKPDQLTVTPEKHRIGPLNIYPINSDNALVENIVLYVEHDDQNSITLKTDEESGPWFFELIVIKDKEKTNIRMDFDGRKGNYRDVLNYLKFLRAIKQNEKLVLEVDHSNKIEMPIEPSKAREVSDEEMTMIENLIYIQEKLSQQIPVTNIHTDPVRIQMIKNLLKNNKLEISLQSLPLSGRKYDVLNLVAELKKQSPMERFEFTVSQTIVNIGSVSLSLPPIKTTIKNVVLDGDINELEQKIDPLQSNENVEFTLKSITNENIVYEIMQ